MKHVMPIIALLALLVPVRAAAQTNTVLVANTAGTPVPTVGPGYVVVQSPHVDINVSYNTNNATFSLGFRNRSGEVQYVGTNAIAYAVTNQRISVPSGSQWSFLGPVGGTFWLFPAYATGAGGATALRALYLGFAAYGVPANTFTGPEGGQVRLRVHSIENLTNPGSGQFFGYELSGTTPVFRLSSSNVYSNNYDIFAGGHGHLNLALTASGMFRVWFVVSGTLVAGGQTIESQPFPLYFGVEQWQIPATGAPVIALGGNLAFGNITVGQTATRTLTISNTGNAALNVSSINYPSGFSGNWNSGNIAAGASQNVTVTFAPNAATDFSGNITVNSDATSGTNTIVASGTGIPAPTRIVALAGNLAFSNLTVGQTATRTLTISNTGNAALNVSSISYPSGFSGNWNSGSIAAGSSTNVTVTFAPNAATNFGGNITVGSDATSGINTIAASGTGTPAPTRIVALAGNLAFGNVTVGQTATRTLTISNSGNAALNVSSISYPSGFSGNWNSGSIAAGSSTNLTVSFTPNTATNFGGNITVGSDATSGTNTIAASGSGTPAPTRIVALAGNLAFGNVTVGQTSTRTLTISNSGNAPLNVSSISYPAGFSGNWNSGSIAAGSATNVNVTFTPNAATNFSGNVTVGSDANSGINAIPASGAGLPPWIAVLSHGQPGFNGTQTSVNVRMRSTPDTALNFLFTGSLSNPVAWLTNNEPRNSGPTGEFDATFTAPGNHTNQWSNQMFFRLRY
jgi:uncharacterized membrane protein